MAITAPAEKYIGQTLYLNPNHGWGWYGADKKPLDYALVDAAGGCHIRVLSFFSWRNEVRGVVGKVEEVGQLFDGLWIVSAEMFKGEHDFTENVCWHYDLELGQQEPSQEEWPRICGEGRLYSGYGVLAETEQQSKYRGQKP